MFRRTARRLIAATPGFEPVGEAASGGEALRLAAELEPDLVLVDARMPGMDGVETARRLRRAHPEAVIVMVSIGDVPGAGEWRCVRKQDLSMRALRELWAAHGGG